MAGDRLQVLDPEAEGSLHRLARRARRHLYWARRQGVGRLIEEDELNPLANSLLALRRLRWRRLHPTVPGHATPVYLVGLQRSGTNMLARGLAASLEFEIRNENDRQAFSRFRLSPDPTIRELVMASRSRFVLFKPLCDSHRVTDLLDHLGTPSPGRAIWMFRSVDGRVRSAVAKFGDVNRQILHAIAEGGADATWQAQGLSGENRELVSSFDYASMSPESAAALFWYIRNSLYFDLGLDRRPDVALACWDSLVADPNMAMAPLCRLLGLDLRPELTAHMSASGRSSARPAAIDPAIRERCDELEGRLRSSLLSALDRTGPV